MSWTVTEEPALRGFTVEWLAGDAMILSRRERLYRRERDEAAAPLGCVPVLWWQSLLSRIRPAQRLLRAMVYNVAPLPDGSLFVTYGRQVGVLRDGQYVSLAGLVRPCRVLRGGAAMDDAGHVYFGEYLVNHDRGPMRVYRHEVGSGRVEVVHEFPAGAIRHVHAVTRDPFDQSLWCLTGDVGNECRLLRTKDGFRNIEVVGGGDETWRCVSLLFTATHIVYATDAEFTRNRVYRLERATGRREAVGELDGPTYYTIACGADLFFAVTAELCPSQVGRSATLWWLDPAGQLERLAAFEKDRLPVSLFLPGTLHLPRGPGRADEFYFYALGLRAADNRTFRVQRRAQGMGDQPDMPLRS